MNEIWPVIAILAAFLVLATLYSVIDPVFEANDELTHDPVVAHIAQGSGLPVSAPYRLFAGLYDPRSGHRLTVLDAQGQSGDNQVLAKTFSAARASIQ